MITKFFEIRDRGTFIPALAIQLNSKNETERFLLSRSGFGQDSIATQRYIYLIHLQANECTYDSHAWNNGARTMYTAHEYIKEHFDSLESGQVICVETILGERDTPKISERI